MGIQQRKEREKEELRQRIITAATKLFQEGEYSVVSMRKIAKEIEYSVGTLYLYYKDKDELFLAVQEAAFQEAFAYIQRQLPVDGTAMDRLHALGEHYIRFGLENPGLYRLMFVLEHPMNALEEDDNWRSGVLLHNLLSSLVQECIEEGSLPPRDSAALGFGLWSLVHGMVSLRISCRMEMYGGLHLIDQPPVEDLDQLVQDTYVIMLNFISSWKS